MLTADSSEVSGNLYGKPDDFAYPDKYTTDHLLDDLAPFAEHYYARQGGRFHFTPARALLRWYHSTPGQHQRNQTCRYGAFHKDLLIPEALGVGQNSPEADQARHEILELLVEHVGHDLHPVGHMALTAARTDSLLFDVPDRDDTFYDADAELLTRHAVALHDIPETLHPGVIVACGAAVGDIPTGRKTEDDKAVEKSILRHQLDNMYADVYPDAFRDNIVNFVRHETAHLYPAVNRYHELSEIAHNLLARETAVSAHDASWHAPLWAAKVLVSLAQQVERNTTPKLKHSLQTVPHLKSQVESQAQILQNRLDEDSFA